MNKFIWGLIYIFISNVFAVDVEFYKKDKITKTIRWQCDHLPYKNATSIVESSDVNVELWYDKNGETQIKFRPDIFAGNILSLGKKVVDQLQNGEEQTPLFINYQTCLEDFVSKYKSDLIDHNQKCSMCVKDINQTIEVLTKTISQKRFIKQFEFHDKTPRYAPGHNLTLWVSNEQRVEITKKICTAEDLSRKDKVTVTSQNMANWIEREISNLDSKVGIDCLKKVLKFNTQVIDNWNCEIINCDVYKNQAQIFLDLDKNIDAKFKQAVMKREKYLLAQKGYHFYHTDDLAQGEREKLLSLLEGNDKYCNSKRGSLKFKDGTTKDHQLIYHFPDIISTLFESSPIVQNKSCASKILTEMMAAHYRNVSLLESEFCLEHGCQMIQKRLNEYDEVITTLIRYVYGKDQIKYYCEKRDGLDHHASSAYEEIKRLMSDMEESFQCSEIKPGEFKVVDKKSYESPTKVEMKYLLEREDEKNLKATLALDFGDNENGIKMHGDVKKCLATMSHYFRGGDEEVIKVNIISKEDREKMPIEKRPPVVKISVGKEDIRSHSREYAQDASCGTMTHEVLHLMGLCDEYKEKKKGYYVDVETGKVLGTEEDEDLKNKENTDFILFYNACRSIAESTSIMSAHWQKINETIKKKRTCECPEGICRQILDNKGPKPMLYLTHNLWSPYDSFKQDHCEHTYIDRTMIKTISELDDFPDRPIQIISESENKVEFYYYDFYIGINSRAEVYKRKYSCSCEQDNCKNALSRLKNDLLSDKTMSNNCPAGTKEIESLDLIPDQPDQPDQLNQPAGISNYDGKTFTFINEPTSFSLLHKSHFERIKWGACKSKVKKYSECAKNSNKKFKKDCPDIPAYCKDENQWLKNSE